MFWLETLQSIATNPATPPISVPINQVQYKIAEDWANAPAWTTCDSTKCQLLNGGAMVEITIDVDYESVFFAANVIGQFVTEAVPFNYRRQPEKVIKTLNLVSNYNTCTHTFLYLSYQKKQ